MARITIVPEDGNVLINREVRQVDMTGIDPAIHAVQWFGATGEIEYTRADGRRNEPISDISPFQVFINRWIAAEPPPPAPPLPKSEAPLDAEEIATLLVSKSIITRAEFDAIKTSR